MNDFKFGLGSWRFFLSFLVAISHLYGNMIHGPAAYAVWGFYVLSGYLMTYIINERYGDSLSGLAKYARNRFLRIFPTYWISFIVGTLTIVIFQSETLDLKRLNPEFFLPTSIYEWIAAASLLPMIPKGGLPVPVSSALAIEIGFYILIAIFASEKRGAWAVLTMSLLINIDIGITLETFAKRYATFLPTLVAFVAGSLVYHYKNNLTRMKRPKLSVFLWLFHCLVWLKYGHWPWKYGLYFSVLLSVWVVISLSDIKEVGFSKLMGEMSYPVYLFHTTVGAWFLLTFGFDRSFGFFTVSFVVTLAISYFIVAFVDRPIERLKVRA